MTTARVLITGASGFVGRWSIAPLLERGMEVHVTERQTRPTPAGVVGHAVDLHDREAVESLIRRVRPTHLLHFAWIATPGVYLTSVDNLVWLRSSLQLVEIFLAYGGRRVVVAGTVAEYEWCGVCSERTTPCRPATLYAACKHAQDEVLERWAAHAGFSFAEGRLFWTYGPHESPERLVPSMIRASDARKPFHLRYPAQVRDYLHVCDAGAAFSALLASEVQGPINIGSGEGVALARLGAIIGRETGEGLVLERSEDPSDDQAPLVTANVTRLSREVGWMPRYRLEDGISETVAWWKAQSRGVQA
jgi:nucleoside-diphosphate-sugar epimerase